MSAMRMWKILFLVLLVLLLAAPAAVAKSSVSVKGRAAGAYELSSAVTLPKGQTSRVTFTLRKSGGAKVTAACHVGYAGAAKSVYTVLRGGGRTC
jgi:curli biogenesis system outer membrane secretion channel CsgG